MNKGRAISICHLRFFICHRLTSTPDPFREDTCVPAARGRQVCSLNDVRGLLPDNDK